MELALAGYARDVAPDADLRIATTIPFDTDRRRMSVVVEQDGERWLYCKGAPEALLPLCDAIGHEGSDLPLDVGGRQTVAKAQQALADRGLRVLAFACKRLGPGEAPVETGFTLSGLIGLDDPPRPGVAEAIARCRSAGIRVVMVTGDHPHTALAIAREIGLARGAEPPDPAVMRRPPRRADERLLSWGVLARAYLWLGPMQAIVSLSVFFVVLHQGGWRWGGALGLHEPLYLQATTACLAAIVAAQVVNVFVCRRPLASA